MANIGKLKFCRNVKKKRSKVLFISNFSVSGECGSFVDFLNGRLHSRCDFNSWRFSCLEKPNLHHKIVMWFDIVVVLKQDVHQLLALLVNFSCCIVTIQSVTSAAIIITALNTAIARANDILLATTALIKKIYNDCCNRLFSVLHFHIEGCNG